MAKAPVAKAESHGLDQPDTISPLAGPIFLLGDDLRFGKATYLPRKTMAIAHPKAVMAEAMAATAASTASKVTAVKDTILKVKVKTTPLTSPSTIRTNTHSRPVLLHTDFLTYFAFPLPSLWYARSRTGKPQSGRQNEMWNELTEVEPAS